MSPFSSPPVQLRVCGRSWPIYRLCFFAGLAAGTAAALLLAAAEGREPAAMLVIALLALGGFLALAWQSSRRDGRERLFYYPAETAALLLAAPYLLATGRPLLPYLDLLAVGLAVAYAFIRVGCHHAGCCHGRAARRGVTYGAEQVADGFPAAYAGRPLFPLQAAEAAIVALLAAGGAVLVARTPLPSGAALCCWLGGYAVARYALDFLREDPETPFLGPLTTAQWQALARAFAATALAAWLGLPFAPGLGLGAALLAVATAARLGWFPRGRFREPASAAAFRSPRVRQLLAGALAAAETRPHRELVPAVQSLAEGHFFSCGSLADGRITHVALSRPEGPIELSTLAALTAAVRASRPRLAAPRCVASGSGIVHLLFDNPES